MSHGIVYLLTGPAHGVRLVVSLWSLRKHYDGPVTVFTTHPDSHKIGAQCAADHRLRVDHRTIAQVAAKKNSTFLTKLAVHLHTPYDVTAQFDADTMVAGDISELLNVSEAEQFCATQFSDWLTTGRHIRARIKPWRNIEQDRYDPQWFLSLIDAALTPQPAVNCGIFAYRRDAELLAPWGELATVGQETFICDEIALQILLRHYPHKLLDCRYNCSPIYGVNKSDARIWHFHGEKHLRHPACRAIWLPAYEECLHENMAGIADWTPGGDRRLAGYLCAQRACREGQSDSQMARTTE